MKTVPENSETHDHNSLTTKHYTTKIPANG